MRLIFTAIILTMFAQPGWADTTNRTKQFSPVPGIFVGGVGLACQSKETLAKEPLAQFLLLTKDRKKIGIAKFEDDDVTYEFRVVTKTTPRHYITHNEDLDPKKLILNRQDLSLISDRDYICQSMSISNLHKMAENHLRALLSENKI